MVAREARLPASAAMDLNIAALHEAVAAAVPDRECIVWRDRRLSWGEVAERTRRFAEVVRRAGLGAHRPFADLAGWESGQDHLALYLHNGNEYLEAMVGSFKARVAPVNVNYRYVAEELAYVLRDAAVRGVVYHSRFAPTLAEVLPGLDDVRLLLQVPDDSGHDLLPGARWYEDALAAASPDLPGDLTSAWSPDDLYILYTGGTTGMPKGVLWRQADFLVAALGVRVASPAEAAAKAPNVKLRTLPCAPFMHGAAHWNAISAFVAGGTVVIQREVARLDPADIWSTCSAEAVTALQIVGDAFAGPLLDELRTHRDRYDLGALRHLLTGGAILSPAHKAAFIELIPGLTVVDVLGSSESGRQAMVQGVASTFAPSPTSRVLSDDLTRVLSPGDDEVGWLATGGAVPRGYLGDPDKTTRTFPTVDGVRYSVPGDRARLRADGAIDLLGRDSVTINSGGEKIFAEEVEQALKSHRSVADAVVVGQPSERWGQEVVAVVALRPGEVRDEAGLLGAAAEHIARYKLPKRIVYVEAVVRSPSGKTDYRWARQAASAGSAGDPSSSAG
jgi:fatty-acyl-CoA synthase